RRHARRDHVFPPARDRRDLFRPRGFLRVSPVDGHERVERRRARGARNRPRALAAVRQLDLQRHAEHGRPAAPAPSASPRERRGAVRGARRPPADLRELQNIEGLDRHRRRRARRLRRSRPVRRVHARRAHRALRPDRECRRPGVRGADRLSHGGPVAVRRLASAVLTSPARRVTTESCCSTFSELARPARYDGVMLLHVLGIVCGLAVVVLAALEPRRLDTGLAFCAGLVAAAIVIGATHVPDPVWGAALTAAGAAVALWTPRAAWMAFACGGVLAAVWAS